MIEFGQWNMRRELSALWQASFHDPERYPRYFLNNCFTPRDCLVYRVGKTIAAAVYLLPARILSGNGSLQAHYIFAAATLPQFRSHGYMSSLLAYAAIAGAKRGDCFSVLLPSEKSLYQFYANAGYSDFFEARMVSVGAERLKSLSLPRRTSGRVIIGSNRLNSLRGSILSGQDGSVLWEDRMFHFVMGISSVYGDRLVCATACGKPSYALCRRQEDGSCSVLELMAEEETFPALAGEILREMPAETYQFRLPAGCGPFAGEGQTVRWGMAKPINGTLPDKVQPSCPYLGLTLD